MLVYCEVLISPILADLRLKCWGIFDICLRLNQENFKIRLASLHYCCYSYCSFITGAEPRKLGPEGKSFYLRIIYTVTQNTTVRLFKHFVIG